MCRRDQRTGLSVVIERSAEADLLGTLDEAVDEFLGDGLLDDESGTSRAHLTGVDESGVERIVQGRLEVGIGEDDVGVLAAELEGDLLDRVRGVAGQQTTGDESAGERDHVDVLVSRQRGTSIGARTEDEVADSGRQTELLEDLHGEDRSVRGQLGGLEDEGVAGGDGRGDLPRSLQQRVVPRGDERTDADGLMHDLRSHGVGAGVDDATGIVCGELAEVVEAVRDVVHVDLRFDEALTGVQGLGLREFVLALTQHSGELQQQVAAFAGGNRRPDAGVEGAAGGLDRQLGVRGAGFVHLGDKAAVGWVVDLPGSTVDG